MSLRKIVAIFLILIAVLGTVELLAWGLWGPPWRNQLGHGANLDGFFFRDPSSRSDSPEAFMARQNPADPGQGSLWESFGYFLTLHPYFAYTLNPRRPGAGGRINSDGFAAPQIPKARSSSEISVAISGGSTASFCYGLMGSDPLEKILNRKFAARAGKPFRVYNLALPGYRQPSITNIYSQFSDRFHVFVSLVGYNEFTMQIIGAPLAKVSSVFSVMNIYGSDRYGNFLIHHFLGGFRHLAATNPLIRNSHLAFGLYRALALGLAKDRPGDFLDTAYPHPPDRSPTQLADEWSKYLLPIGAAQKAGGAHYIMALQPLILSGAGNQAEQEDLSALHQNADRIRSLIENLSRVARSHGLEFASYVNEFEHRPELFRDSCHFHENAADSENGCTMLAEKLADKIFAQASSL